LRAYLLFFVGKYNVLDFELIQFYFEISELPFGWEKVRILYLGGINIAVIVI
jgi:hypothetical protein